MTTKAKTEPCLNPICSLYDIEGHATQNCPNLPLLCTHMDTIVDTNDAPVVNVPDPLVVKNKSLRTNDPFAVCSLYGHYYHHFKDFPKYRSLLHDLRKHSPESDVTVLEEINPLASSSNTSDTI